MKKKKTFHKKQVLLNQKKNTLSIATFTDSPSSDLSFFHLFPTLFFLSSSLMSFSSHLSSPSALRCPSLSSLSLALSLLNDTDHSFSRSV